MAAAGLAEAYGAFPCVDLGDGGRRAVLVKDELGLRLSALFGSLPEASGWANDCALALSDADGSDLRCRVQVLDDPRNSSDGDCLYEARVSSDRGVSVHSEEWEGIVKECVDAHAKAKRISEGFEPWSGPIIPGPLTTARAEAMGGGPDISVRSF